MNDAASAPNVRRNVGFAHWRLGTRLVVLSVLLLLLLQAAAFVALRASVQRNATKALYEQLAVGERIWQRLLDQRATKLTQGASLLAALPFRDNVTTVTPIAPLLVLMLLIANGGGAISVDGWLARVPGGRRVARSTMT